MFSMQQEVGGDIVLAFGNKKLTIVAASIGSLDDDDFVL